MEMDFSQFDEDRWRWVTVGGACVGGGLSSILAYSATGSLFSGAIVGFLLGSTLFGNLLRLVGNLNLIHLGVERLHKRVGAAEAEIQATTNIRPLLGDRPLDTEGWSLSAETCERLVHEIQNRSPSIIVECGSGESTVLMAICLRAYQIEGRILSLDHKSKYARKTRARLARSEVSDYANVVTAPLVEHEVEGQSVLWYDFDPRSHLEASINFLVVDGPPRQSGPMARLPAVPVFHDYLAENGLILLDDAHRPDEQEAAQHWAERLGVEATVEGRWRPYFVFDRDVA